MHIFADGLVAFLAAVGLMAILWLLAELLLSRRSTPLPAAVMVAVQGDSRALDYALWLAYTAAQRLGRDATVIVLDSGLDESARLRGAQLQENDPRLVILPAGELETYIKR